MIKAVGDEHSKMEVSLLGPRDLVQYREPSDKSGLVTKASDDLRELMLILDGYPEEVLPGIVDNDIIEEVIKTLHELESERQWMHQAVEAETIKSSVLRHRLQNFPRDTDWEIAAAVKVVRESNNAAIEDYKNKIKLTGERQKELQEKAEYYRKANALLGEEHKQLREKYDTTLCSVNETLLKKSTMQIKLNTTRENIRDTKMKKNDFELGIVELNEDMITERRDSDVEQAALLAQIEETRKKLSAQRSENLVEKKSLDAILEQQLISAAGLERVLHKNKDAGDVNRSLQEDFDDLAQVLERKIRENHTLASQKSAAIAEIMNMKEQCEMEQIKLETGINGVTSELDVVRAEFTSLDKQKIANEDMLQSEERAEKKDEESAEETFSKLKSDREDLRLQSNECARFKRLNSETQGAIVRVQQEHIAAAEIVSKEIESLVESLESERKERQLLQNRRDEIIKEANDYVNDFNAFASQTTRSINEGKILFQKKSEEGRKLQQMLKEVEIEMKSKQKELQDAKTSYIQRQRDMKGRVKKLESSIQQLEKDLMVKLKACDDELPDFNLLQEVVEQETAGFQELKKRVVEVKIKKADYEESVEEKLGRLNDMEIPKKNMINSINENRRKYLEQLDIESAQMRTLENDIYEANQKLSSVNVQNLRFRDAVEFLEAEIGFMYERMEVMCDGRLRIDITTEEYRQWLEGQWRRHLDLDRLYYDRHMLLMEDIKRVEEKTAERERRILDIHGQLEGHLDSMTKFIKAISL